MLPRKKPSNRDARASLSNSLSVYGVDVERTGQHSNFRRKLTTQVEYQLAYQHSPPQYHHDTKNIPSNMSSLVVKKLP